ncbi:hypothetical protein [Streptomyces sp. NPDC096033]|uniref:hypothetical protein n=1 Tax=Streptomyces sp. NPDC096033 TaxID=3366071 RepID=UPI00381F43C6
MTETATGPDHAPDPLKPVPVLRRELQTGPLGLSGRVSATLATHLRSSTSDRRPNARPGYHTW